MADIALLKSKANIMLVEAECVECGGKIVFDKIDRGNGFMHHCTDCDKEYHMIIKFPYLEVNGKYKIYMDNK